MAPRQQGFCRSRRRCVPLAGLLALTVLPLIWSCASGPQTGVRSDFQQRQLDTVAVVPFYSSSSFGMGDEAFEAIRTRYEAAAVAALEHRGFDVVESPVFRRHLEDRELWDKFDRGIPGRQPLTNFFDYDGEGDPSVEIRTIRDLARRGAFDVQTLLVGEIVYHTTGTCRKSADDHIPYARSTVTSTAPDDGASPCVTSHFRAKLVDVSTGRTMWFNRMLVETHTGRIDETTVAETIDGTVETAITAEDDGLTPLAPPAADEPRADSD